MLNTQLMQTERRATDPAQADAIDAFCARVNACRASKTAFTLVLDDPAGARGASLVCWMVLWGRGFPGTSGQEQHLSNL